MATYVISDIHGEYDMFLEMLEKIELKDSDILYILGDVVDRGPHPIKVLLKLMEMPNVIPIVGNHEVMAVDGLKFLIQEITYESLGSISAETYGNIIDWQLNGNEPTINEFRELEPEMRKRIIEYLFDFLMYEKINVSGRKYLLVHSGIGGFKPGTSVEDYSLYNLVWARADYDMQYFDDVYVVSGHTPTHFIKDNPRPGYIYRKNNHIAIDCGACSPIGRLAAIRLDDGKEFYVERRT